MNEQKGSATDAAVYAYHRWRDEDEHDQERRSAIAFRAFCAGYTQWLRHAERRRDSPPMSVAIFPDLLV